MQTNGYAVAITFCDQALGINRGDDAATKLRLEAQKNLDAMVAAHERDSKYQAAMKQASAAFSGNDYSNAALFAEQALTIKAQDSSAKSLLADAQAKLDAIRAAQEQGQKYQTAMAEAQSAFDQGKYDVATRQAEVALASRGNDPKATALKQQVVDIQSAQGSFTSGDYDTALALCAKYPNISAFANLAQKVNAPRNALSDARTRFNSGDYSFIAKLETSEYAKMAAFAMLLTSAKGENQTLQNLEKLTNSPANWATVKSSLATVAPAVAAKPPFQQVEKWVEQNDPVKILDAQLDLLRVWFGRRSPDNSIIDPNTHHPAQRLESGTDIESLRRFEAQLSAQFDSLHELTATRKGYFKDLEGAMNRW
jgi:hypothetical protein